jgi:hypothetical protein
LIRLTQAVRKSRSQPGVDQIVSLRNRTITAHRQHNLDIEVDGFPVMTLSIQLVVRVQLYDAVAVVRDGQLVAVRSGQAKADGTVTVDGVQVTTKTTYSRNSPKEDAHDHHRLARPARSDRTADDWNSVGADSGLPVRSLGWSRHDKVGVSVDGWQDAAGEFLRHISLYDTEGKQLTATDARALAAALLEAADALELVQSQPDPHR